MDCSPPDFSMGFSRQEYWSGLPFPFPGNLPNPGIEPMAPDVSPAFQADLLLGKPTFCCRHTLFCTLLSPPLICFKSNTPVPMEKFCSLIAAWCPPVPHSPDSQSVIPVPGEGNGTPLQYSCLENPMDGGAWKAAVRGVAEGRTRLSNFTFTFHFHALEKEMATHSSVLPWRIPGTGEPGGLPSMGSHRVGHD